MNNLRHILFPYLLLLFTNFCPLPSAFSPVSAQQYPWRHYTTDDGLVQNQVISLYEDTKGFIWFGTKGGVSRFDGINFDNYTIQDGLIDNQVNDILGDTTGTVYVFSNGGINCFKNRNLSTFRLPGFVKIKSFTIDSLNRVWVVYQNKEILQLLVLDGDSVHLRDVTSLFNCASGCEFITWDNISNRVLFRDHDQNWVLEGDSLVEVPFDPVRFPDLYLKQLEENYREFNKNSATGTLAIPEDSPIENLCMDQSRGIWGVIGNEKLVYLTTNSRESFTEPFYFLNRLMVDRYNHVWVATEYGCWKLMDQAFKGYYIKDSLAYPWRVFEDSKNDLWVANYGTGLVKISKDQLAFWKGQVFPRYLYGGIEGPDDAYYFFGRGGFHKKTGDDFYEIRGFSPRNDLTVTHGIYNKSDSTYWVGVDNRLIYTWRPGSVPVNISERLNLIFSEIYFIQSDTLSGGILIGSKNGIVRVANGHFEIIEIEGFSDQGARTCWQDPDGKYWFGNARGIAWMSGDSSGFIDDIPFRDGVTSMVRTGSDGFLIGTPKDLIYWDCGSYIVDGHLRYRRYNEFNGYQGGGVRTEGIIRSRDGTFWICGEYQLVNWDIDGSSVASGPYELYLRELSWMSDSLTWVDCTGDIVKVANDVSTLELSRGKNSIRIILGAISAPVPEEVIIEYYLEGFEQGWSRLTMPGEIKYSRLLPGKYILHYKPHLTDFVPVEHLLKIRIYPAYHQTWLFRIVVPLIIIGLIMLAVWWITFRVQKNKRLIDQKEKENSQLKLHMILNQMNPHFTHNVLNSIGALVYARQPSEVYEQLTRFSRMLRGLLQDEGQVIITLQQEIEFVANYLELEKLRFEDRFEYQLPVLKDSEKHMHIPKMLVQIPVENALKHGLLSTKGPGRLRIYLESDEQETRIIISDNGIGRTESKRLGLKGTGRGFEIMDSLIRFSNEEHIGKFSYSVQDPPESDSNRTGTIVTIIIRTLT